MKNRENNKVIISGKVVSDFQLKRTIFGEDFYIFKISSMRLSDKEDVIPVMVSERLLDISDSWLGKIVVVNGEYRSYNKHYYHESEKKSHLILNVFANEIFMVGNDEERFEDDSNEILLGGFICKEPIYRKTPLGREIANMLLAVNRSYGKSDYIPCICWGRNARFVESLAIGTNIQIWGRIQSREYQKKIFENEYETRTAYEVSVSRIEV